MTQILFLISRLTLKLPTLVWWPINQLQGRVNNVRLLEMKALPLQLYWAWFLKHTSYLSSIFPIKKGIYLFIPPRVRPKCRIFQYSNPKYRLLQYYIRFLIHSTKNIEIRDHDKKGSFFFKIEMWKRKKKIKKGLNWKELKDTFFMNRSTWLHTAASAYITMLKGRVKRVE